MGTIAVYGACRVRRQNGRKHQRMRFKKQRRRLGTYMCSILVHERNGAPFQLFSVRQLPLHILLCLLQTGKQQLVL